MSAAEKLRKMVLVSEGRPSADTVTVALSGGADSTALLLLLCWLREVRPIEIRAVHVHHGIRGAEADRDAAFCAALCEKYHVPLQTVYVDAPALARTEGISLETAARRLRYEALELAAPEGEIATAHHAGDNAETILFRMIRGTGLRGLCGIPARSGRIIRPLLEAEKSDILAYLKECGQTYVEDSTNAENAASRNRIRQELIPAMCAENPAFLQHMTQMAQMLTEDNADIERRARAVRNTLVGSHTTGLYGIRRYHRLLRMRIYTDLLEHMPEWMVRGGRIDPSFERLRAIDGIVMRNKGKISIGRGICAMMHEGSLYFVKPAPVDYTEYPLSPGENRSIPGRICRAMRLGPLNSRNIHKYDTYSTLDFDKIIGVPYFRQWRASDRLHAAQGRGPASLKKLIQNDVPAPVRRRLYVLYDDAGCIWCEGIGADRRVLPDADTTNVLRLMASSEENADCRF